MDSAHRALKEPSKNIDGRIAVCNLASTGSTAGTSYVDQAQRKLRRRGSALASVSAWSLRRSGTLLCLKLAACLLALNLLLVYIWWHSSGTELEWETREENLAMTRRQFVLFGDSLTQQSFRNGGWGAALADRYARKADVLLRGYGGYNTRWALYLLNDIFPAKPAVIPSLVTVFFGANDAALPDRDSKRQHVPIPEYKDNLQRIVSHLKALSESIRIILITPPPIDEKGRRVYARLMYGDKAQELPERTNEVSGLYAEACQDVARQNKLPSINLWSLLQRKINWQELYLSDGLHLTEAGNAVVFEELVKILEDLTLGTSLGVDTLPVDYPLHSSVDPNDPAKAFANL